MSKHTAEQPLEQFSFPFMLSEHPLVKMGIAEEIVPLLQSNAYWQKVTGTHAAVVDMIHSMAVIVEPATLNVEYAAMSMDLHNIHQLGGVALLLSHVSSPESDRKLFASYNKPITPGGIFLVVEANVDPANIDLRKQVLHDAGFAHTGVTDQGNFLVWHANKRRAIHHSETNIWETPRASITAQENFTAMQNDYRVAGFVVLNTQLIKERLAKSTFVPGDLEMLRQGREVVVQSPCGCAVHHMKNGEWKIVELTCDGSHVGLSEAIQQFESFTALKPTIERRMPHTEILDHMPEGEEIIGTHGDGLCGGNYVRVAIGLKTVLHHGKPYQRLQMEEYCTSCGYEPFADRTRLVDAPLAG